VKLNRKTQPVVYRHIGIRTTLLDERQRRSRALLDIAVAIYGLAFVVVLMAWLG